MQGDKPLAGCGPQFAISLTVWHAGTEHQMTRRSTDEIAEDVLSYFLRNPQAADNLEGVARWRLLSEAIHRTVEETSQVLESLVSQGLLLKMGAGGADPVYCLNWARRADAEARLSNLLQRASESQRGGAPKSGGHTSGE
jgi:hypothetical protein